MDYGNMDDILDQFCKLLEPKNKRNRRLATDSDIARFSVSRSLQIPPDLRKYFTTVNGTQSGWDGINEFYPLSQFLPVMQGDAFWHRFPNEKSPIERLPDPDHCYEFANHSLNVVSWCIRLYSQSTLTNEVYVVCGPHYRQLADSFTHFIEQYLIDPWSLLI
jgi:SMI1 / KNR4 family (SUKH-1)